MAESVSQDLDDAGIMGSNPSANHMVKMSGKQHHTLHLPTQQ